MPAHAARRPRAVRHQRDRPRGLRRGGGRPLRQRGRRRARRVRVAVTDWERTAASSGCEPPAPSGGACRAARWPLRAPPRRGVRARPLLHRVRGDGRAARHGDQARPAAARLAAAGRARAVRAARHRALDAAPGADRADAERARVRHARPRRRHVRLRPAAARRPALAAGARALARDLRPSASRSSWAWRCSRPSAPSPPTSTRSIEIAAALEGALEDFARLPQGRRAPARRPRRSHRLARAWCAR